jgi:transcriptional regulator with XRE-family HTH domain
MASPINPTVPKRQLGMVLAGLRETAGRSREEAAEVLDCSVSKIGRLENGHVGIRSSELKVLLEWLGINGDERAEIESLGKETRQRRPRTGRSKSVPPWFLRYINMEEAASEIRVYNGELIPGLAQTEAYARAVMTASQLHSPDDVDRLVDGRIRRQAVLTSATPTKLWIITTEGVLRTQAGGREAMREQLKHLVDLADLRTVTIQVIPFAAGAHASMGFPYLLLRFEDDPFDVAYVEHLGSAEYFDRKDDPQRKQYVTVWDHQSAVALPPSESLRLIHTVKREL